MNFKTIIGLETHIELTTKQKMFCSCKASYFGTKANTNVCPVCLALPGALPVVNQHAVNYTLLIGLALNCKINDQSFFERKHYFYPDLPKGYQISQYAKPLCYDGFLIIDGKKVRINRVHLEEDTGKLIHQNSLENNKTCVDFNRAGVPLVEIVTEPDIDNPKLAVKYLQKLQLIVQYLGVSSCDMEKGSMRCEPNISVIEKAVWQKQKKLPSYKVEIKNINSFRFVEKAISYEISRQSLLLEKKQTPKQQTRRYDESTKTTQNMRSKEFAEDYRYFPEPDIPPLQFSESDIKKIKQSLKDKQLPEQRKQFLLKECDLEEQTAKLLTENKPLGDKYLLLIIKDKTINKRKLANLLINKKISASLSPEMFLEKAKKLLIKKTVSQQTVEQTVKKVLLSNPQAVKDFNQGKPAAAKYLLGQCLAILGRQIDIRRLEQELSKQLRLE